MFSACGEGPKRNPPMRKRACSSVTLSENGAQTNFCATDFESLATTRDIARLTLFQACRGSRPCFRARAVSGDGMTLRLATTRTPLTRMNTTQQKTPRRTLLYGRGACGAVFAVDGRPRLKPGLGSEALAHLGGRRPRVKYPNCCNGCGYRKRGHCFNQNARWRTAIQRDCLKHVCLENARQAVDLAMFRGPDILPGGVILAPRALANAAVAPSDTRHFHRRKFARDHSRFLCDVHSG